MCCLALVAGFIGPRLAAIPVVDLRPHGWTWHLLLDLAGTRHLLLPWTTLAYVLMWRSVEAWRAGTGSSLDSVSRSTSPRTARVPRSRATRQPRTSKASPQPIMAGRRMADAIFEHPRLAAIYDALDPDRSDLGVYVATTDELGARSVLDVGCGTGTFALLLVGRGLEVTGADPARARRIPARARRPRSRPPRRGRALRHRRAERTSPCW